MHRQSEEVMDRQEREEALTKMRAAASAFYGAAVGAGCHPFIEFAGLMNEYIKCCETAHARGIDFTNCNTHSGRQLPMEAYQVDYVNEKLECIFTGRSVLSQMAASTQKEEAEIGAAASATVSTEQTPAPVSGPAQKGRAEVGAVCGKCNGGVLAEGSAMVTTLVGVSDFPRGKVVTMSPGGQGRLVACLKCSSCGHSLTLGSGAEESSCSGVNLVWQSTPPKEPGFWMLRCGESGPEPERLEVASVLGVLVTDAGIGTMPVDQLHDGLTKPEWAFCESEAVKGDQA